MREEAAAERAVRDGGSGWFQFHQNWGMPDILRYFEGGHDDRPMILVIFGVITRKETLFGWTSSGWTSSGWPGR